MKYAGLRRTTFLNPLRVSISFGCPECLRPNGLHSGAYSHPQHVSVCVKLHPENNLLTL